MISQRYNFTSIQTILSKFYRDLKDTSISQDDLIEWIGEAMGFMKMPQIQEEAVSFLEVKDYQTALPKGFQAVIQIAKKKNTDSLHNCKCEVANECETKTVIDKICEEVLIPATSGNIIERQTSTGVGTPCTHLILNHSNTTGSDNYILTIDYGTSLSNAAVLHKLDIGGCNINIASLPGITGIPYTHNGPNGIRIYLDDNIHIGSTNFINCLIANGYLPSLIPNGQIQGCTNNLQVTTFDNIYEPIKNYKQLVRYRKYKDNTLIETSYEDCNGSFYQLVGNIVNCPESLNCVPCKNYKNDCSSDNIILYNECGEIINDTTLVNYFTLRKNHIDWINQKYYQHSFTPVVLTNHSFFNSIVCKEQRDIYTETTNLQDEYTVIGSFPNIALRFSFKDGIIALSHLKTQLDEEGYPLIPDDSACQAALVYYLKWKIAERLSWSGREGFANLAKDSEQHWLKYCKQFKSKTKMPFGIDQYQNLMERQHYLIPDTQKFLGYFGQLTR